MNRTLALVRALGCAAALLFCTAFVLPETAAAQAACCDVTYTNNTACPITFCIRTASGPICVTVAAGGTVVITLPAALCNNPAMYVVDRCDNNVKLPLTGCISPVALSPGCCAQICVTSGIAGCWFVTANPLAVKCLCPLPAELGALAR